MTRKGLLAVVAFVICAFLAGVGVSAQVARGSRPVTPKVIAGPDVGFRVEQMQGTTPIGTLVVRVNGEWVEAQLSGGVLK